MMPSSHISRNNQRKVCQSAFYLLFISLWMTAGCTSKHAGKITRDSKKEGVLTVLDDTSAIQDLVSLVPTEGVAYQTGGVYIDSVRKIIRNNRPGLLIHGNLPSGCSSLLKIEHVAEGDTLRLMMESWKPKNKRCTQQLIPFSYLYYPDIPVNDLEKMQFCDVNGQIVPLKP